MRLGFVLNNLLLPALVAGLMLCSACSNDMKKIREISERQVNNTVDTTKMVDLIYSDSAKVKVRLITPLLLEYNQSKTVPKPFMKMPQGVTIIFYNDSTKKSGTITADTAYNYPDGSNNRFVLHKNVVVKNVKGDVFKSDDLNWDGSTHKIYSNMPVDMFMTNGTKGHGTSMETNEKFDPFTVKNQSGIIYLDKSLEQ